LIYDKLGGLDACTTTLVHGGVGNCLESQALGIHKQIGWTPSKDWACLSFEVFALRRYYDFHQFGLLRVVELTSWGLADWGF
jgi:hypothetical protein